MVEILHSVQDDNVRAGLLALHGIIRKVFVFANYLVST